MNHYRKASKYHERNRDVNVRAESLRVQLFTFLVCVNDDVAPLSRFNSCLRQSQRFHIWSPTDGPQETVRVEARTPVCLYSETGGIFLHLRHLRVLYDLDSRLLHFLGDPVADILVKSPQHFLLPDQHSDVGAQVMQDCRHLDRDVSGPRDDGTP